MNRIKSLGLLAAAAGFCIVLASSPAALGDTLLDISSTVSVADPTQSGRISRDGMASGWSAQKTFPGIISFGAVFHYRTFTVFNGSSGLNELNCRFVQASLDDSNTAVFLSAYLDGYAPNPAAPPNGGLNINYLGDAGSTAYRSGTDVSFLQVFVPAGHTLVLVVAEISANTGTAKPFRLLVEGFTDTQFSDARPGIISSTFSNTNVVLNATNGIAGRTYALRSSTNVSLPLSQWSSLATNVPPSNGSFTVSATNTSKPLDPQRFFMLQSPTE